MDIKVFVNLTSRAWALPLLARLHAGVPARQAPLLAATGASRTAFAQSLAHLVALGMLERNPGHGHPLRPEFRLTPLGAKAAEMAHRIEAASSSEDQPLLRRSWTVPILTSLHQPRQFNDIRRTLPPITDRALSQSLKSMEAHDWVRRRVDDAARPPRAVYSAINTGAQISQIAAPDITWGGPGA